MIPFSNIISKIYSYKDYYALCQETRNVTCYNGPLGEYTGPALLPWSITNPDKCLRFYCHKAYRITETEATDDRIRSLVRETQSFSENTYVVSFLCFTKGITFVNNYFNSNSDYTFLDRVSLYLQQGPSHKVRVYKNKNRIIIVTNDSSVGMEQAAFSAIPLFFKTEFTWDEKLIKYFQLANRNDEASEEEMKSIFIEYAKATINTAKRKELERDLACVANYQKEANIRKLKEIQTSINSYENQLIQLYSQEKEQQAKVTFFKASIDIAEIVDYIENTKYITDYFSHNNRFFVVAIEAPLEYIDVPALKKMLANPTSYLYPQISMHEHMPESVLQHETEFISFIKDLFITGKYRVYTRSEIVLDFETKKAFPLRYAGNYSVSNILGYKPSSWSLKSRFQENPKKCITPHMHIEYYDCWSGNKTNISKALNKNDIIGALDIAINTTKDINVNDGAVFGRFIRQGLFNPSEFREVGRLPGSEPVNFLMPGNQFKTIWDTEKECFRTFDDIFQNDYIKDTLNKVEI